MSVCSASDDSFLDGLITPSLDYELKMNLDSSKANMSKNATPAISCDLVGSNLFKDEKPKETHSLALQKKKLFISNQWSKWAK